jgi:LmbE family N-acetylglucosaminyl deacetylase
VGAKLKIYILSHTLFSMILIFAAHPDDEILGCGGTIAKFSRKGEKIVCVIFSYGEGSNPILDPKLLAQKRKKESAKADKILGVNRTIFLGLEDNPFSNVIGPEIEKKIENITKRYKPEFIFTHCIDDLNPFHRRVAVKVKRIVDQLKLKPRVYTFETNSLFRLAHRNKPKLYVDISDTIKKKRDALTQFDEGLLYYKALVLIKNKLAGMRIKRKYAEVFYSW